MNSKHLCLAGLAGVELVGALGTPSGLDGVWLPPEASNDPDLNHGDVRFQPVRSRSAKNEMELTMTTFDKREQGFEAKFVHDEELMFKATARSNKLLGLWAAAQLGLGGDAAADYATALVTDSQTIDDVMGKVSGDLAARGVSREQVAQKLQECLHQAMQQLEADK
jgi:hypothetical protein